MQQVHPGLSHRCHHGALRTRRPPLHLLPHDRTPRTDSRGTAPRDGQPHLWLRRLSARVSLEQVRARSPSPGFPRASRARRTTTQRALRVDCRGLRRKDAWLGHLSHRLRALAAQHRSCPRQRTDDARDSHCAAQQSRRRLGARPGARGVGPGTALLPGARRPPPAARSPTRARPADCRSASPCRAGLRRARRVRGQPAKAPKDRSGDARRNSRGENRGP